MGFSLGGLNKLNQLCGGWLEEEGQAKCRATRDGVSLSSAIAFVIVTTVAKEVSSWHGR